MSVRMASSKHNNRLKDSGTCILLLIIYGRRENLGSCLHGLLEVSFDGRNSSHKMLLSHVEFFIARPLLDVFQQDTQSAAPQMHGVRSWIPHLVSLHLLQDIFPEG